MTKLNIFLIMPFDDELNALYRHLKDKYADMADFQRADDFLNQQNILKDIVRPIMKADLIIADLTGLNANVFYELGLAHAFRKNVVLITQDISELPFDLRSYRVIEYSTHFARIKDFEENLTRLIKEFASISFGSPVTDWVPLEEQIESLYKNTNTNTISVPQIEETIDRENDENQEKGFIDFIADLEEAMNELTNLIEIFTEQTTEIGATVNSHTNQAEIAIKQGGSASSIRKIARLVAQSMKEYGSFVANLNKQYESLWNVYDDSLTNLINSRFIMKEENRIDFISYMDTLTELKDTMLTTKELIDQMVKGIEGLIGIEASITRAASLISREVKYFQGLIDKSVSTINRISVLVRENLHNH